MYNIDFFKILWLKCFYIKTAEQNYINVEFTLTFMEVFSTGTVLMYIDVVNSDFEEIFIKCQMSILESNKNSYNDKKMCNAATQI